MVDAPGPWGTGPFHLVEGHSVLDPEQAVIAREPFAATWLWRETRTPRVRLAANPDYWDTGRGPHLAEVVFRNDLSPERALELVCTTEGEVDIVTEPPPAAAKRVEESEHARLVSSDAIRTIAGVINREAEGTPLADPRARQALNLAIDRDGLIKEAMFGYAKPTVGLTPPSGSLFLDRVLHPLSRPYGHEPVQATSRWWAAGGAECRPLRLVAFRKLELVARKVAADLEAALEIPVAVAICQSREEELAIRRRLAEKTAPQAWDILLLEVAAQAADSVATEMHRAFVGADGEYRAGPIVPEFEEMYAQLTAETSRLKQAEIAHGLDRLVHEQALALFLCAPDALYAVNKQVDFMPYRTTFELANTKVGDKHWSRR